MPLGVQRINAPQSAHPTPHIAFIKPLPGPGAHDAEEFLSRVAAIVHPILTKHHLAVMTLEEHEPNAEFLGRNFNAGEVIQLVLRRKRQRPQGEQSLPGSTSSSTSAAIPRNAIQTVTTVTARTGPGSEDRPTWLPFRSVVLVMLHELAHCVQMNHSRAFWKVRNVYADEMRELWQRGYTGEGMWGRGRAVGNFLQLDGPTVGLEDDMPAHLCGGVYRRRRKGRGTKRKRETESYAERHQRRIKRKFGDGGMALGDDAERRAELERKANSNEKAAGAGQGTGPGKRKAAPSAAKPRVAQSKRGRELRAQAALARLGQLGHNGEGSGDIKREDEQRGQGKLPFTKAEPGLDLEREIKQEDISTASETESETASGSETESEAEYSSGTTAETDLVKVCPGTGVSLHGGTDTAEDEEHVKAERQELDDLYAIPLASSPTASPTPAKPVEERAQEPPPPPLSNTEPSSTANGTSHSTSANKNEHEDKNSGKEITCPACSLSNSPLIACCVACGCVLRPRKVPGHWRCQAPSCREGSYVNSGDYGVCGVCGLRRKDE